MLERLYRQSLGLLTDLYQMTMAYGYWKTGRPDHEAVFNLYFRKNPFRGGYTVCCGLESVIAYLAGFKYEPEDLEYLASLRGNDDAPLFEQGFLDYLEKMQIACDVDAVPEGTVVFPLEPLLRVRGPIVQAQLLETPLLNLINFPTLIATKAARVCHAAAGDPVVEFGLRRAQGIDGSVTATRASYVGGCVATSSLIAGRLLGIPVRGTHAHSWVMFFDSEREAFLEYAKAMPNNSVFLVDTYDSVEGTRRAVEAGRWLRDHGHEMSGIRLDSGDLAYLSRQARDILDSAGFGEAKILASNELDENVIASLKQQRACIGLWGVGTRMVTADGDPALGGVYKLAAVRAASGKWDYRLKLSEQAIKTSTPGLLQVRRYRVRDEFVGDAIYDERLGIEDGATLVDPLDATRRKSLPAGTPFEDLLVPVCCQGRQVYESPTLDALRERARSQLASLHDGIKRFDNPHGYPVGLELQLHETRTALILEARRKQRR